MEVAAAATTTKNLLFRIVFFFTLLSMTLGQEVETSKKLPLVVSTWLFLEAVKAAWRAVDSGFSAVEAVVEAFVEKLDKYSVFTNQSPGPYVVGPGGSPDENGETMIDALVMDGATMEVGAVAAMRYVKDGIRAARLVIQHTDHTMLVGEQASIFAMSMGLAGPTNLSSMESLEKWMKWKKNDCQPNFRKHVRPIGSCGPYHPEETMGQSQSKCLMANQADNQMEIISCRWDTLLLGTSTNGATFKIPGRVGDRPIAGSSSYADNEVGACGATGDGDIMMRFLPCYQVVESMRLEMEPELAAKDAISRIARKYPNFVGAVFAINKQGLHAGVSILREKPGNGRCGKAGEVEHLNAILADDEIAFREREHVVRDVDSSTSVPSPSMSWDDDSAIGPSSSLGRAAQTLNPIATNAATTFSLLRSLGQPPAQPPDSHQPHAQPLRNQTATNQPPAQPLRNQTATDPASCAASVQPLRNQTATATNPASYAVQPQSRAAQSPAQPCAASYGPVQPPIREIQPRLVMADSLKEVVLAHMVPVPSPVPVSLSHSQPAQRVTSVLLNGKNFHAWSRSFQLYPSGKRKTHWILGKEPKPAEAPTALHDDPIPPRPLPILEPPSSPFASQDLSPCAQAPLPASSPESGMSPPLVSDILPPRNGDCLVEDKSHPDIQVDGQGQGQGPVLTSNFVLDHVGEVVLTLNSNGLSWSLIESIHKEQGGSSCLGIKLGPKSETAIKFSDVYAVEFIVWGLVQEPILANARGCLLGHGSEMYRFTVHGVQRSMTQPSLWAPSIYTFGHKDMDTMPGVFVHPKSGKGNGFRTWEAVAPIFSRAKVKTKGGDGFFNEILNGLLSSRFKAPYPPAPADFVPSVENDDCVMVRDANEIVAGPSDSRKDNSPLLPRFRLNESRSTKFRSADGCGDTDQGPEFSLPNKWFRFGIIPAGSTDAIVICTTGTRDPITSALHIVLGKRVCLDIAQVVRWKTTSKSTPEDEPCVRYAASFAGYGFYGDVIKESEKYCWMGPKRYDYAGTMVFLRHWSYEAELAYLEVNSEKTSSASEKGLQSGRKRALWGLPKKAERTACRINCDVCDQKISMYNHQAATYHNYRIQTN
ncbi:N-terminal nucleophile aminohydrolases (Ntn hydrolases) superfamily protein [Actinidia rufa]|uniref:beta-aspartyl-peptidase n=1 Tax=Actinidia rufa TaxID=165716 RepID=A0A7J0EDY2_9ERIC|nr:N-terminal nucleophile aminohydrolases (Ntn hydrolases) superfamily protein [Actinidia rufa]